jgi:phosphoglycolate phosphatase
MVSPAFDLIVFDLDGTLVDSRLDLANSVNEMVASRGAAPLSIDAITGMIGEGARLLVERALAATRLEQAVEPALRQFLDIYERRMLECTRCYDGIEAMLEALDSIAPLAVLTNKPLGPTEQILRGLGLRPRFREVHGGDGPLPRKPEPDGLLFLSRQFGATPSRTLMVGDSLVDARTAQSAGTRCCLVGYGFGFPGQHALGAHPRCLVAETPADIVSMCMR